MGIEGGRGGGILLGPMGMEGVLLLRLTITGGLMNGAAGLTMVGARR